ncbi:MAG TPA: extracellular solute-binding protein [Candidatus Limnocylindrales bacterium]|jgi:spermidine/putrescine transport system substrate-binding protein|nr:extracellular solute-binding protein [Candidatus Limnocylindrales bacterium]
MTDRIDTAIASVDITRRRFLAGSAVAGFAAFLAACGTPGTGSTAPAASTAATTPPASVAATAEATTAAAPSGGGKLNFANWIGYIDIDDNNKYPTLEKFTKETQVEVNYKEDIDSNEGFFTSDLQAPLSAGQPTEWDLIVVTDWMVARLARLQWLETINTAWMQNFPQNLLEPYHGRSFDPDTNLAAPWQSGMTGIGFDQKKTGPLDSVNVFWDEKWKQNMTYLDEMRDTVGLAAIKLGSKPEELTEDQFQAALAEVDKAVKAGIPQAIAGNYYVDVMAAGDAVVGMAWSGDVLNLLQPDQKDSQDFQWALPKEGGMLWTDNMVIPKGAKNKGQAELWINFYYEPVNAATVEAYVYYVCPVKGARDAILAIDDSLAANTLIFPTDAMTALLHQFRATTEDEETRWAEDFSKVAGL